MLTTSFHELIRPRTWAQQTTFLYRTWILTCCKSSVATHLTTSMIVWTHSWDRDGQLYLNTKAIDYKSLSRLLRNISPLISPVLDQCGGLWGNVPFPLFLRKLFMLESKGRWIEWFPYSTLRRLLLILSSSGFTKALRV